MKKKLTFYIIILIFAFFILNLSGCAAAPPRPQVQPAPVSAPEGVYHKVQPKETLWRISRAYEVRIEDIVEANDLEDPSKIQEGQLILIPGAKQQVKLDQVSIPQSAGGDFIWPVSGRIISFYGAKDKSVVNKGIDIECLEGTNVVASQNGVVSYVNDSMRGYGKVIIIDHSDNFSTVYAYNNEIVVRPGEDIGQGQVIAKSGSGGRSDASCLHFEIRKNHEPQNPFYYLP